MISTPGNQPLLNYLSGNRAVLTIPSLSTTSFTINGFALPSLSLPPATQDTPFIIKPRQGETLTYGELNVNFIVTENLANWLELHNWFRSLGAPSTKEEFRNRKFTMLDGYITIYTSHNNPLITVKFLDLVPVSLGALNFTEELQETSTVTCNLVMAYERYDLEFV